MRWRAYLQRGLGVLVSLVFLFLALRGVRFDALWAALRSANYLWLLPAVFFTLTVSMLKGWRWQLLFCPEYRLPYSSVFTAMSAGYLASNVLPGRVGELVRLVLLCGEQPVSATRTLSTIIVERVLDVLTLLVLLLFLLPFISVELPPVVLRGAQAGVVVALAGSLLIVLLSARKGLLLGWAHAVFGRLRFLDRPALYRAIEQLIDGFAALRSRLGLVTIVQSLAAWIVVLAMAWTAAIAMHLDVPLTAVCLAVAVTTLGMLLPSSPGYFGVFEGLTVAALAPFGVPPDVAFGYALVWHAVNYLSLCVIGVIAVWVHGVSLRQVFRWRKGSAGEMAGTAGTS